MLRRVRACVRVRVPQSYQFILLGADVQRCVIEQLVLRSDPLALVQYPAIEGRPLVEVIHRLGEEVVPRVGAVSQLVREEHGRGKGEGRHAQANCGRRLEEQGEHAPHIANLDRRQEDKSTHQ